VSTAPGQTNVSALLDRGDAFAATDARAAMSFYQAALQAARTSPDRSTLNRLRSAQEFIQRRASEFQQSLDRALADFEPDHPVARLRLTHSLEMLKGQREIYPQQPTVFYYPYLAQRQYFEREEFDWVGELEAATPVIRDELLALLNEGADFRPYVENDPNRPVRDFHGLNEDPSWSALYLWKDGRLVEDYAARCPRTVEALRKVQCRRSARARPRCCSPASSLARTSRRTMECSTAA